MRRGGGREESTLAGTEFRKTLPGWEVHCSARKHGVSDADMLHAVERALVAHLLDSREEPGEGNGGPIRELWVGPDRAGNLLELVVLWFDDGRPLLIHAMKLRRKYWDVLSGWEV